MVRKKITKRKRAKKTMDEQIKLGDSVAVYWHDITHHYRIKSSRLKKEKWIDHLTRIIPTITYGVVAGIRNKSIAISLEFCEDVIAEATLVAVIPVGCIEKIVIFKQKKIVKGEMYST